MGSLLVIAASTVFMCLSRARPAPAASTPPAPKKAPTQIYEGVLGGKTVWLELTRTPQGISGKLGSTLQTASTPVSLELPPDSTDDVPPSFIPQRLSATDCRLTIAGNNPSGLHAACLASLQGPAFCGEFPELIVEDAPDATGTQLWLRAVAPESVAALASFGASLAQAEPRDPKACLRSVRIDQMLRANGRTFLAYWTWDVCGGALVAAARSGKADPGKAPWRETAWLGVIQAGANNVTHIAAGARETANDSLALTNLGGLDALDVLQLQRSGEDAYPTGVNMDTQTRVYVAPPSGPLTLALGPFSSASHGGNCFGSDVSTDVFLTAAGAAPSELIVRTRKTQREFHPDRCDSSEHMTYRDYRLNPKSAKYAAFQRAGLEDLVKAQATP